MKILYYVVVYRPVGSNTWTPADLMFKDKPAGNFFSSKTKAKEAVLDRVNKGWSTYSGNPQKIVGAELTVASVIIQEPPSVSTALPFKVELS